MVNILIMQVAKRYKMNITNWEYIEMHQQEIRPIGRSVEIFCAPLYTDYLYDLHKKF